MSDLPNHDSPSFLQRVRWPLALAVLLIGHSLLLLVAFMVSGVNRSGAVTQSSYEAAVGWDERQEEKRQSERLGWSLGVQPESTAQLNCDRLVVFRLFDRKDTPLDDAALNVRIYHHSRAEESLDVIPEAISPGHYQSLISMRREGLYHIDAVAVRGTERCRFEFDYWLGKPEENQP